MLLENQVAIVTGAARGIGKGIATKFAVEGCDVAVVDILEDRARETATEITAMGRQAIAIGCDHTKSGQVKEMVDRVMDKFGKIDILINNAGGGVRQPGKEGASVGGARPSLEDYTEEVWHANLDLNLTGPFLCSKYVVPHMKKRQYGKIVFTSSAVATGITSVMHPYCAAKAGVVGLMYSMALELAPYKIRVNAVLPDLIGTEFYGPPSAERDANLANRAKVLLMGRVGTPEDIAGPTLFLASDLSAYVTGISVFVGGKYPAGQVPATPPE